MWPSVWSVWSGTMLHVCTSMIALYGWLFRDFSKFTIRVAVCCGMSLDLAWTQPS